MDATPLCAVCGAAFTITRRYRWPQIYCSKPCKGKGDQAKRTRYDRCKPRYADCPACGQYFQQTYTGRNTFSSYCSRRCASRANRSIGRATILRWCKECDRVLRPGLIRFCGRDCYLSSQRKSWNAEVERKGTHAEVTVGCKHCGQRFTYQRYNKAREFCGKRCARNYERTQHPERKADEQRRRNAAKRAVPVGERFKTLEIYERDRWICQLCGKPTKRKYSRSDLMSPTLDHIVPVIQGGPHTRLNVQLAHLICNSLKGDRGSSQMRLFD